MSRRHASVGCRQQLQGSGHCASSVQYAGLLPVNRLHEAQTQARAKARVPLRMTFPPIQDIKPTVARCRQPDRSASSAEATRTWPALATRHRTPRPGQRQQHDTGPDQPQPAAQRSSAGQRRLVHSSPPVAAGDLGSLALTVLREAHATGHRQAHADSLAVSPHGQAPDGPGPRSRPSGPASHQTVADDLGLQLGAHFAGLVFAKVMVSRWGRKPGRTTLSS